MPVAGLSATGGPIGASSIANWTAPGSAANSVRGATVPVAWALTSSASVAVEGFGEETALTSVGISWFWSGTCVVTPLVLAVRFQSPTAPWLVSP